MTTRNIGRVGPWTVVWESTTAHDLGNYWVWGPPPRALGDHYVLHRLSDPDFRREINMTDDEYLEIEGLINREIAREIADNGQATPHPDD